MSPVVLRVDPRVPGVWTAAIPFLSDALQYGGLRDWDLCHIKQMAQDGQVQFWILVDCDEVFGACVTTEGLYPKRKVLEILLLGTAPHSEGRWRVCMDQMLAMARANGFSALTGSGRPGWSRKLGATSERTVWEYDLGDTHE